MSDFVDPYIDPKTSILRNLVGAATYPELRRAEGDIVALSEISLAHIPHSVDLIELQKIHKNLFSKIYDWAGELRIVNIRKGSEEYFLDYAFSMNSLTLSIRFVRAIRTQRIFWQRVANEVGYIIDWNRVVGEELNNASLIGRTKNNLDPLEKMFNRIITT